MKPLINFNYGNRSIKIQNTPPFPVGYNVTLTQAQLDDIHDFYHENRKQSLKDIIYYRFINMVLGFIFLIAMFIFSESYRENWFQMIVLAVFFFYNQIHGLMNWIQYKRIKEPKRPSDE